MTAPATTRRAGPFNGNGVTTSFPFTFKVFATSDIAVIKTSTASLESTLALGSDYSITLNPDQDASPGGSITYPISGTPLAAGEKLTAIGALPYDQTADLPTGGNYRAIVVENALDRTVFQVQQLAEELGRSLTLPPSAATADTQLPVPEAGKVIAWNSDGTGLVNLDSGDLASVVVAGTSYTDVFNGTGAQTAFALTANPGSVNALDVAISGVSKVNGVDFSISGTTLTFTAAPAAGTGNVVARYVAALPVGTTNAQDVVYTPDDTTVADALASLDSRTGNLETPWGSIRRRVPALFVRGDGNTRTDVFPICVRHPGPGGVEVSKTPLDIARSLGNVIARQNDADVWVSPNGAGTFAGTSRANAMSWAAAWRTLATGRKLLLIDTDGTYPPLSLISGTDAGAAVPKWLFAVDGRVRMAADTALGQPVSQTWTAHSGSIYKTVLTSVDYDRPQCVLATLVPDARDGQPKSILKYASVAELTALGSGGEGWYFDAATDTLYLTYYGNDLTIAGNRNFKIIYSSKTLDSTGDFSAEWLLGGATVIFEGNFEFDGISINSYEANSTLPILLAEGRLQQLCATSYGLRVEGLTYTSGRRCYRSQYDGLNGYKANASGTVGFTIEHDLAVIGAGDIGTYGTGGPHNCQGFSAHGAHNVMIFGALFEGNDGQGWADICDSTHDSASWGVGVISRDNYIDAGISYGVYMDGSAGGGSGGRSAWLDTCTSEGNVRDVAAVAADVKLVNCRLTTQTTASGGTIGAYSPEAP